MNVGLGGKVLVTAAGSGFATATLVDEGAVAVRGRDAGRVQSAGEQPKENGGEALGFVAAVGRAEDLERLFAQVQGALGGGRIVTMVSSSVKPLSNPLSNVFRPAVQGLRKLASEPAGDTIGVDCLAPGRIEAERIFGAALAEEQGKSFGEARKNSLTSLPMGRSGKPSFGQVAALRSEKTTTGSTVFVGGGSVTCS